MRPIRYAFLLPSLLLPVIFSQSAWSDEAPVFEIHSAMFGLEDTLLVLDAQLGIRLPDYIAMAIDQGFAVPMSFEVEILESKKYWLDRKIISLKQQYLLHYLPMLNAYVVSDVNQGQRAYFDSRDDAVKSIQVIAQYPMLDIGNFNVEINVYARMRFGLDSDELPLPLKSSSLWHNDWDLQSDWFSWELDRAEP